MKKYVLIAKNRSEKHPKEFILMCKNTWKNWNDKAIFFHDLSDMKMLAKTTPSRFTQYEPKKMAEAFIMVFPTHEDAKKMLLQIFMWAEHSDYWKNFLATHYIRIANANNENFPYVIPDVIKKSGRNKWVNYTTKYKSKDICIYKELIELPGFFTEDFYSKCSVKVVEKWKQHKKKTQEYIKKAGLSEEIAILPNKKDYEDYEDYKYLINNIYNFSDYKYSYEINYTYFGAMYKKGSKLCVK